MENQKSSVLDKKFKYIKNNPIRFAVLSVSAIVFLVSAVMLIKTQVDYKTGEQIYEGIVEEFITPTPSAEHSSVNSDPIVDINTPPISVDFEKLKKVNKDIVAWIYCEDTPINYPIVNCNTAADYDKYLVTAVDGKKNKAGSIFLDYRNASDLTDLNTVIYGHSMKNGSMFAYLLRYDDQAFYENHKYMWLFTEDATYRIELISGNEVNATSEDYVIYKDAAQFKSYLERSVALSRFDSKTDLQGVKNIVTLSTCAYSQEDSRYVVLGNLVKIKK